MISASNRRWLRFSLRTQFVVVTCACVWLAWTARHVQERRAAVESIQRGGGKVFLVAEAAGNKASEFTLIRHWCGDSAVAQIEPPPAASPDDEDRIRKLFPEAYVYYLPRDANREASP